MSRCHPPVHILVIVLLVFDLVLAPPGIALAFVWGGKWRQGLMGMFGERRVGEGKGSGIEQGRGEDQGSTGEGRGQCQRREKGGWEVARWQGRVGQGSGRWQGRGRVVRGVHLQLAMVEFTIENAPGVDALTLTEKAD